MFEYILRNKRNTYAYDNKTGINSFENTENIEEIIKTSNNIEELKLLYKNLEDNYKDEILKNSDNLLTIFKNSLILIGISLLFLNKFLFIISFIILIKDTINLVKQTIKQNKIYNEFNNKFELINSMINEEENTLMKLKNNDKKIEIKSEQKRIDLKRSDKINNLYKILWLIEFTQQNYKKLKKLYKTNELDEVLLEILEKEDINFIKFLIINKNYIKEEVKVKQLKK